MKITSFRFILFCNFLLFCLSVTIHKSNTGKSMILNSLRKEVDHLIDQLKQEKFPANLNMTKSEKVDYLKSEKKIQEDILNTFRSLNDDFVNYEKIIKEGKNKKPEETQTKIQNEVKADDKGLEHLLDPEVKEEENIVDQIKKTTQLIKKFKKHPKILRNKKNIKNSFNKMLNLFDSYKQYDNEIKHNFQKEIEGLKAQVNQSKLTTENIKKALNSFADTIKYSEGLLSNQGKSGEELTQKKQILTNYRNYIAKIDSTEKEGNETRKEIENKMQDIMKSPKRLYKKADQILRLQKSLMKIAKVNERTIQIKKKILEKLNKNSMPNLNSLNNLIIKKKEDTLKNNERIENVKKMFNIANNIDKSHENLGKVKNKIEENIKKIDEKATNMTSSQIPSDKFDHSEMENLVNGAAEEEEGKEESDVREEHDHGDRISDEGEGKDKIRINNVKTKNDKILKNIPKKEMNNTVVDSRDINSDDDEDLNEHEEEESSIGHEIEDKIKEKQGHFKNSHEKELKPVHESVVNNLAKATQNNSEVKKDHQSLTNNLEIAKIKDQQILNKVEVSHESDHAVTNYLEKLTEMSERALKQIESNNERTEENHNILYQIINKLETLHKQIETLSNNKSLNEDGIDNVHEGHIDEPEYYEEAPLEHKHSNLKKHKKQHHSHHPDKRGKEIQVLKEQIHKLTNLYKNVKRDSENNFLRNQVLKKLLSKNSLILENHKVEKSRQVIRHHK